MTSQARNDIVEKLTNKTLSLPDWTELVSTIDQEQLGAVVPLLVTNITLHEQQYVEFLRTLVFYDQDEDRLTGVLEYQ